MCSNQLPFDKNTLIANSHSCARMKSFRIASPDCRSVFLLALVGTALATPLVSTHVIAPAPSGYPRVAQMLNGSLLACAETPVVGKLQQISWFSSHDGGSVWNRHGIVVEDTWDSVDLANCFI